MNIGARLEAIGNLVPRGASLADIGTDHAYLPSWLAERDIITRAVAGDLVPGPCNAARNTVAMNDLKDKIEVRMGNGLSIVQPGETDVVVIAGMGAGTIIEILEADMAVAKAAQKLILQPMAGAPSLRRWANANGWILADEVLVEEGRHLYEIIVLEDGTEAEASPAEYEIGPRLLEKKMPLLSVQFKKIIGNYRRLLQNMRRGEEALKSEKYKCAQSLLQELEVLYDECYSK